MITLHKCTFNASAIVIVFLSISLLISISHATEEYAEETGTDCNTCHIDPLGGGELTESGKGYLLSIDPSSSRATATQTTVSQIIKLVILYAHIVTAFLWFGTILYVHLVLKPAYASKGLPRGEVKVGLVSMGVMAITGTILTYYKVPSVTLLFSSRFGILLLAKITIFMIMVTSALYVVFVIGPKLKKKKKAQQIYSSEMTLGELANFDGEEGRPAYFAYKNEIYDVSQSKLWKEGNHMARHYAGGDLTDILSQAPHGEEKILAMPKAGRLSITKVPEQENIHKKVFFAMAYMNLGFVFVISLILALWRW